MMHGPVSNSYLQLCHMIREIVHVRAMTLTCMLVIFEHLTVKPGQASPKDNSINEFFFQKLNPLEVVDFRFISAFNIPSSMHHEQ